MLCISKHFEITRGHHKYNFKHTLYVNIKKRKTEPIHFSIQ